MPGHVGECLVGVTPELFEKRLVTHDDFWWAPYFVVLISVGCLDEDYAYTSAY